MKITIDTRYKGHGDDRFDARSLKEFDWSIEVKPEDDEISAGETSNALIKFAKMIRDACRAANSDSSGIATLLVDIKARHDQIAEVCTVAALGATLGLPEMIEYVESHNALTKKGMKETHDFFQLLVNTFQVEGQRMVEGDVDAVTGEETCDRIIELFPDTPEEVKPFEDFLNGLDDKGDD